MSANLKNNADYLFKIQLETKAKTTNATPAANPNLAIRFTNPLLIHRFLGGKKKSATIQKIMKASKPATTPDIMATMAIIFSSVYLSPVSF